MLRAVYKTGSSLLFKNPRDTDIVKIFDTKEEARECFKHNHDHSVDYHFDWLDRIPKIFLWCYLYPLMELIEGEEIEAIKNFNICDHKKEYKELAMKFIAHCKHSQKNWYHILVACYMFENGKNEITEEQKEQVQKVHDNGITEELKEYCINILNEIK